MSELMTNIEEIETTPITTLQSLAAEGKFVSAIQALPYDWFDADWKFTFDGIEYLGQNIVEIYAPGGPLGWAVTYVSDVEGRPTGQTILIRGNWTIERKPKAVEPKQELSEVPIG